MRSRNAIMTSGVGSPTVPHPVLPFRMEAHDGNGPTPALGLSYYPLKITELVSRNWWWRFRRATCQMAVDGGAGLTVTRTFTIVRYRNKLSPTEPTVKDLNLPGFSRADEQAAPLDGATFYQGNYSEPGWNGNPLAQLSFGVSLRLFDLGEAGEPDEAMDRRADWYRGDNTLLPAIKIGFDVLLTTPGTEAVCFGGSYPDDPDEGTIVTSSLFAGHGGGSVRTWNSLGSPLSVTLTIAPSLWFARDFNGLRPVWNSANGVRILPVFQVPM